MTTARLHSWSPGTLDSARRVAGTVAAVMSAPLVTIQVNASSTDAMALMRQRDIRHLLLTDRGRIVAVVSDRDLVPEAPGGLESRDQRDHGRRPVFLSAHYHLVTIAADATVEEAAEAMLTQRVSSLPVLNRAGEIAGIVTSRDLLRSLARRDTPGPIADGPMRP